MYPFKHFALTALLGVTSSAFALTFTASNNTAVFLNTTPNDAYSNTVAGLLDITTGNPTNYNPATMQLTSASLTFKFSDTFDPTGDDIFDLWDLDFGVFGNGFEIISVSVNGTPIATNVEVDGSHANFDTQINGTVISGSIFAQLQTTGKLSYGVTITHGDTWFKGAELSAIGNVRPPQTPGVPDSGSTVALLGGALLAVGAIARRRSAA